MMSCHVFHFPGAGTVVVKVGSLKGTMCSVYKSEVVACQL